MLTPEQIKNLKPGDTILIQGTFDSLTEYGNICYISKYASEKGVFFTSSRTAHPSLISLPENGKKNTEATPKYDPCRRFRKGDIVRLREYNGRKPYDYWHKQVIKNFGAKLDTVLEDELDSGNVDIFQDAPIDELTVRVNSCHLELVTPVEELDPYRVETGGYNRFRIKKGDLEYSYFPFGEHCVLSMDEAKAEAEAECKRLNEEYRKENK